MLYNPRTYYLALLIVFLSMPLGCASQPPQAIVVKPTPTIELVPESAYTEEQLIALKEILVLNDNGTLRAIEPSTQIYKALKLSPNEVDNMNLAIDEINESVIFGYFIVQADFGNVAAPILLAARGYWWCVAKVLKCELLSAGCILAAPACVASCTAVCTGTAGLGCVACVTACTAGGIALCDSAYDCWVEADNAGCIP